MLAGNKNPSLARGAFGEGFGRGARSNLLRLLHLIGAGGGRSGVVGELLQVVLQQADFDAATADVLGAGVVGRRGRIAHADEIDAIDRNLVGENEIAHNRLSHFLRAGDGSLSLAGRESLDFEDVSALTFDGGCHLVDRVLGVLGENGLAGAEADFGLVLRLVLVDVADHVFDRGDARGDLLRGLLRGGRFVAGVDGVLIGGVSLVGGELDAGLSARVGVFNVLRVSGGQIVEFVDAVADRFGLALYILFARERIHASPETFAGGRRKRRLAGRGVRRGLSLG